MPAEAFRNHLIHEKSPYLLQHARNPVDWYPWGEAAFARARAGDKPVFLSIGYSTCHWCHVMARESFEDAEVAEALNRDFVSVKVDREERPDVDAVYMAACHALGGAGGWPLTVLMTAEGRPFWVGTYLPKTAGYGGFGLLELLEAVAARWKEGGQARAELLRAGDTVAEALKRREEPRAGGAVPGKRLLRDAFGWFQNAFDPQWGGFGSAPKFPAPHNLLFLMDYAALEDEPAALAMASRTLEGMLRGGIFDHIGGGFSRYSTDEKWLVPHFEKMLYDNALLAQACLEAFRRTDRPLFRRGARRTLNYALRELRGAEGGFFCAQDADSGGGEGRYYLFTPREVCRVLGETDGELFCRRFGITEEGNFEGASIPNRLGDPGFGENDPALDALCEKLYAYRRERIRLRSDDKILTGWNALMLGALADAARILREPAFLAAARGTRDFLFRRLAGDGGRLFARWCDGEAAFGGSLDDYAFLALGLLKLYDAAYDPADLAHAAEIARRMAELFGDSSEGGFFLTARDAETLLTRPKEVYDGAMPSGNAAAAQVLVRLASLTGEPFWRELAEKQLSFLASRAEAMPAAHAAALQAMGEALRPGAELVVCARDGAPAGLPELLNSLPRSPRTLLKTAENAAALGKAAPFTAPYPIPETGAGFYLCRHGACLAPVHSLGALRESLTGGA